MKHFIVFDDFYQDPQAIRRIALEAEYEAHEGHSYPGMNSKTNYDVDPRIFSAIVGETLKPSHGMIYGQFRISSAFDSYDQDIHIDFSESRNLRWTAVLYLNTSDQYLIDNKTIPGTQLWRHTKHNFEIAPRSPEEGAKYGWNSYEQMHKELILQDGNKRFLWENTFTAPMKFNRLVMFNPIAFHSHGVNFGETKEDSRLVQIFFLDKA